MPRPNLLLILTDQQRWDTIHAAGNPIIRTPNLDRLAAEGVRFTAAYTPAPVCVPARCSLLYGQYPAHTGCTDNDDPMPQDRPSLMDLLARAGYTTHGTGKMHFTPDAQALRGFHSRDRQEEIPDSLADDDYLQYLQANGYGHVYDLFGQRSEMYYIPQIAQVPAQHHGSNWVGERAAAFIRQASSSQPFFLMASFIHPHPPFSPPTPWNKLYRAPLMPLPKRPEGYEALQTYHNRWQNRYKYRDAGQDDNLLRTMKAYYYACISFVDYQVGKLLRALEDSGQLEDTLILFTSDHGELLGDYGCFGKRCMLDSAARLPLLIRYPKLFPAGRVCETPVSLVDVMPTLLAAAGLEWSGLGLQGVDLAGLVAGGLDDRTVYSQFRRAELGLYMALSRRWKYFYSAPDRREFLFDREQDPGETRNRAGVDFCRPALDEMRGRLLAFMRSQAEAAAVDGDNWRLYPQPQMPTDPDAGLLVQDPGWSAAFQHIAGYSD